MSHFFFDVTSRLMCLHFTAPPAVTFLQVSRNLLITTVDRSRPSSSWIKQVLFFMTRTLCVLCRRKQKLLHLRKLEMTCPQLPLPPQKENTGKLAKHGFTVYNRHKKCRKISQKWGKYHWGISILPLIY